MASATTYSGPDDRDTRRPRLLYVITDLEVGGVPLHLLRLAPAVRAAGWDVAVTSLKPSGPIGDRLRDAGIAVRTCDTTSPVDWRVIDRLSAHVGDYAPDLVHAFLFHANLAARLAGVLGGFPTEGILCEIQTVEIERTWHLRVDRWTHPLSRLVIGNSRSVVDHLHRAARIPRDRLRLVEGGVDVERIAAADPIPRSQLGVEADQALLLWVGRMDPVKGLDVLIDAFDRVRQEVRARLLLAGDGPERERVAADVARRGLVGEVALLGRRDDVPRLLRSADLFAFPSRTEGFPNALLEAMAADVPVVATDVAGCRDLVTDGETGCLVPVDDAKSLSDAIVDLLGNRAKAERMSRVARSHVASSYTENSCHQRYLRLYREVLSDARTYNHT